MASPKIAVNKIAIYEGYGCQEDIGILLLTAPASTLLGRQPWNNMNEE
jgi:hypothetical protein